MTEAVLHTFGFALCNLLSIPTSKISRHVVDERNRSYVESGWSSSSPQWRSRAATTMNRLAIEAGRSPFQLNSPSAAVHWRNWLEQVPFPSQPFSRFPTAKVSRGQLRVVFEGIPAIRWRAARTAAFEILSQLPNVETVIADPIDPDIGFRLKPLRNWIGTKLDPAEFRRAIVGKWQELTDSSLDSYVLNQTIFLKYRDTLPYRR